jgi:hypothetical protein
MGKAILTLKNAWDKLGAPEKRELLKTILQKVVWNEKGEVDIFIRGTL